VSGIPDRLLISRSLGRELLELVERISLGLRPCRERQRYFHRPGEARRDLELDRAERRIRARDEHLHPDRHDAVAVRPLVRGAEYAVVHIERLMIGTQRGIVVVEPAAAVRNVQRVPGGEHGDADHVSGSVLIHAGHERGCGKCSRR
jgi:hypothetical protein